MLNESKAYGIINASNNPNSQAILHGRGISLRDLTVHSSFISDNTLARMFEGYGFSAQCLSPLYHPTRRHIFWFSFRRPQTTAVPGFQGSLCRGPSPTFQASFSSWPQSGASQAFTLRRTVFGCTSLRALGYIWL